MSIDRTQAMKPVSTVQSRDNNDATTSKVRSSAPAKTNESSSTAATVSLSDAQSQLMKPGSQDINTARVEQLKTAIRNGDLKMDSGKIADALISDTKTWLENN